MTLGVRLCVSFTTHSPLCMTIPIEIIAGTGAGFLFQTPVIALHVFKPGGYCTCNIDSGLYSVCGTGTFPCFWRCGIHNSIDGQVSELNAKGVVESFAQV